MSDVVKWGLLTAGLIALIGLVAALPFNTYINLDRFSAEVTNFVDVTSDFLYNARALINCFLSPFGRRVLTGIMAWLFGKWAITVAIKIVAWVYHFVFRG